jgi:hypothetical protein
MEDMTATATYAIDPDDRILWTDEGFADLANGHGLASLAADAIGRPLIDFVAGERPRALQQALLARARRAPAAEPLELRYRCDSPDTRRFAVLQMAAQRDGTIVFTTWFESTEARPYQALLDAAGEHGDQTVTLCAWCNRVDSGDGWCEVEDMTTGTRPPAVKHGLCEICELLLTGRPGAGPRSSGPSGRP